MGKPASAVVLKTVLTGVSELLLFKGNLVKKPGVVLLTSEPKVKR